MKLRIKIIAIFIFLSLLAVISYQIYWVRSFYKEQLAKIETDVAIAMRDANYDSKPDFSTYSNFLQIELFRKGIVLESFIEKINLEDNTVLESIPRDISQINKFDFKSYVFPFDVNGTYAYRLNLKQPELYVIKKMSGILIGSLLLIALIIFSYFYLYRIIIRQRSIDEIKSDFVNNMTHELKTPISVAYAATDALLNFGIIDNPEKRLQYLQISKEQLSRLSSLVEQILTMSVEERKNLKLDTESINLSELFTHLKNQYLLNANKKVDIEINVNPKNLTIKADKIHFPNSIGNLIENSIKYSGDNVQITLSAEEINEKLIISIKDNGIGIPAASLPKIFDRFYRVSTGNIHDVKGYGLGLYYVKTIIEKLGGKISVKSKEGEGTEFIIRSE